MLRGGLTFRQIAIIQTSAMDRSAYTIAVVDDHDLARYAAVKMLQSLGYRTVESATGEEAQFIATTQPVSAVLLDVNLPDVNGVKVCEYLKNSPNPLPVVLMSAVYIDELHKGAGMAAGADHYLVSPLEPQELGAVFDRLLGAGQQT
jgi:CheY-like chemotaxis protein